MPPSLGVAFDIKTSVRVLVHSWPGVEYRTPPPDTRVLMNLCQRRQAIENRRLKKNWGTKKIAERMARDFEDEG